MPGSGAYFLAIFAKFIALKDTKNAKVQLGKTHVDNYLNVYERFDKNNKENENINLLLDENVNQGSGGRVNGRYSRSSDWLMRIRSFTKLVPG